MTTQESPTHIPNTLRKKTSSKSQKALVWVVEKSNSFCDQLKTQLKEEGAYSLRFASGDHALTAFKESEQKPDIIIAHLKAEGLSGPSLLKRVHALNPNIPFLFILDEISLQAVHELQDLNSPLFISKDSYSAENFSKLYDLCLAQKKNKRFKKKTEARKQEERKAFDLIKELPSELNKADSEAQLIQRFFTLWELQDLPAECLYFKYNALDSSLELIDRHPENLFSKIQPKFPLSHEGIEALGKGRTLSEALKACHSFERFLSEVEVTDHEDYLTKPTQWKSYELATKKLPQGLFLLNFNQLPTYVEKFFESSLGILSTFYENILLHKKLLEVNEYNSATQLLKESSFEKRLQREMKISERLHFPLSTFAMKINGLQEFEETSTPYEVAQLKLYLAKILFRSFRSSDYFALCKPDCMLGALPFTSYNMALKKLEKFWKISQELINLKPEYRKSISLSFKVAEFPQHCSSTQELMDLIKTEFTGFKYAATQSLVETQAATGHIARFDSQRLPTQKLYDRNEF